MNTSDFLRDVVDPALDALSGICHRSMNADEARVMTLAIALQESALKDRRQVGGGPARSFWQFESGGGCVGVMTHKASAGPAMDVCKILLVPFERADVFEALAWHDHLSAAFARLLLFTDAAPLPALGDVDGAWEYYLRNWRPGKPHPDVWPGNYARAMQAVRGSRLDAAAPPPVDPAMRSLPPMLEATVVEPAPNAAAPATMAKPNVKTSEFWMMLGGAALTLAPMLLPVVDRYADGASGLSGGMLFAAGVVRSLLKMVVAYSATRGVRT